MSIKKRLLRMKNKLICKVSPVKYAKSLGVKMGGGVRRFTPQMWECGVLSLGL